MRNFAFAASAVLSVLVGQAFAAPVTGYEALYAANYAACVLPDGTIEDCSVAISNYSGALVAGGVSAEDSNDSFSALRAEVYAANEADVAFRDMIDALFEELLPDSGSITDVDLVDPQAAAIVTDKSGDEIDPSSAQ